MAEAIAVDEYEDAELDTMLEEVVRIEVVELVESAGDDEVEGLEGAGDIELVEVVV